MLFTRLEICKKKLWMMINNMRNKIKSCAFSNWRKGFTLVEIMVSVIIMAVAIGATFQIINHILWLNETNDNIIPTMNAIQGIMDEIRNVPFDDISPNYNNMLFTLNNLTNRGVPHQGLVTVNIIEAGYLLRAKVVVCWRQKNRIMGEDANFNGTLDSGEDANGNNEIDSPCSVESVIMFR